MSTFEPVTETGVPSLNAFKASWRAFYLSISNEIILLAKGDIPRGRLSSSLLESGLISGDVSYASFFLIMKLNIFSVCNLFIPVPPSIDTGLAPAFCGVPAAAVY